MQNLECLRGKLENRHEVLVHNVLNSPPSYHVIDIWQNSLHVQHVLPHREQEADCYSGSEN